MANAVVKREFEFNKADFRFIASLVHEKTGIVLADHKEDMVYARIARRLRSLNMRSFIDYCALLQQGGEEIGNFVNAVTTNLTAFFRESHHFDHLRDQVLKPLAMKPPPNRRVRLWSSACSTGAEPYSIALMCLEAIPDIANWDFKILATDIDTKMVAKATAGLYTADEAEPIPASLRNKYTQTDRKTGEVQMGNELRKLITFKQLNLIESWPFKGPFDAVFCRNVVIYFDKDTQRTLFDAIASRTKMEGWLYIGHSERLNGICERYALRGKTLYQRTS